MSLKNTLLSIMLFSCAIVIAQQQSKSIIETLKEKEKMIDAEAHRFILFVFFFAAATLRPIVYGIWQI